MAEARTATVDYSKFYQADVRNFPTEEINLLIREIEDSGAMMKDSLDYEPGDYIRAVHERYWDLHREQRRRMDLANPEEAASRNRCRSLLDEVNEVTLRALNDSLLINPSIYGKLKLG